VLAYHFVRTALTPPTASELDGLVEGWFADRWHERLDFEVEDGLRKVRELSLITEDGEGRLRAVTLTEAKLRMDRIWDDVFDYSRPAANAAQRTA
jgi:hypothetical protein